MLSEIFKQLCLLIILGNVTYGGIQDSSSTETLLSVKNKTNFIDAKSTGNLVGENPQNVVILKDRTHNGRELGITDHDDEFRSSATSDKIGLVESSPLYENPSKNDGKQTVSKKGVIFDITTPNDSIKSTDINFTGHTESTSEKIIQEEYTKTNIIVLVVILFSIPLLILLIIGSYKLWSEWWQHRHYRRMDFLIEGMYNN